MRKIVVNKCYGGFGLSALAVKRIAEIQGRKAYFFEGFGSEGYGKPIPLNELGKRSFFSAFDIPNPDEAFGNKSWKDMTPEERKAQNNLIEAHSIEPRNIGRSDPTLVQIVEELGDKANGNYANLVIVEIPDDVEWEIEEYDGQEWVSEKHRTW